MLRSHCQRFGCRGTLIDATSPRPSVLPIKRTKARKVPLHVERNPLGRDESIVQESQISPEQHYKVLVNTLLFISHFCTRNQ